MSRTTVEFSITGSNFDNSIYRAFADPEGIEAAKDILNQVKLELIRIDREVLKEEIANGFDQKNVLVVDGVRGKSVFDVNPLGKIERFARQDLGPALIEIFQTLKMKSKVDFGFYKAAHVVFFNKILVADRESSLTSFITNVLPKQKLEGSTITFVNVAAYARRLETNAVRSVGKIQAKPRRKLVKYRKSSRIAKLPNGPYWITSRSAKYKFKAVGNIEFKYLVGSELGIGRLSLSMGFKRDRFKKDQRNYLYPSIQIKLSEKGIL
jgi:hypothetical protein